jgi:two-component system sensor histidine kinase DegS
LKNRFTYIWLFGGLFAVLVVDAYYEIKSMTVPVYTTEWFWWRVIPITLILAGLLVYYYFNKQKLNKKIIEETKVKMSEAQETEWKKIAGELHDNIGQNLSAVNMLLQTNTNKLDDDSEEKGQFRYASEMLVETIEDVRMLSNKIYPQQIERLGLTTAIRSLTEKLSASTGIHFNLKIDNIDNLFPFETELSFYRILQEVTNNIMKHSRSSVVDINITKSLLLVHCEIEDNGVGFDMNQYIDEDVSKLGFGLLNLQERINMINGDYTVSSEPDKGTKMKITIPVKRIR